MSIVQFGQNEGHSVGLRPGMRNPMTDNVSQDVESIKSDDDEDEKTIHSGHFMISRVHESSPNNDDDYEAPSIVQSPILGGFSFMDASKEACKTYRFGPRSTQTLAIDASLTKLFECMTLAYSGKLTSPKWKQFRGMHVKVKDKIRLNNIIWREWVMQYIYGKLPIVCQFATPLSDRNMHMKPEAIVLEGYYWKRRLDTVTEEYKLWRKFYKDQHNKSHEVGMDYEESGHTELLDRVQEVYSLTTIPKRQHTSNTDLLLNTRDISDMMDLSDSLISSLKPPLPFDFPNPKEMSGFGYGYFIQPGLLQLQPNLDDFMDIDQLVNQEVTNTARQVANNAAQSMPGSSGLSQNKQVPPETTPIAQASSSSNTQGCENTILQMVMSCPDGATPSPLPAPSNSPTSTLLDSLQAVGSPSPRPSPASNTPSLLDSLQASVSPSPQSIAASPTTNTFLDSLQSSASPAGETPMVVDPAVDSENFILNQLQLIKQQNEQRKQQQQEHEQSLQQQLQHQQQLLIQEQQKKQQQQQQKQQQQQQVQGQKLHEQISMLLQQNSQLTETLSSGNITANQLIEELIKGGQITVIPTTSQTADSSRGKVIETKEIPTKPPQELQAISGKWQESQAIPMNPREIQAIPAKSREIKAIPAKSREIQAILAKTREVQTIPGQSRISQKSFSNTKPQTVSGTQESSIMQTGSTTKSVLQAFLASENLNTNMTNKPKPVAPRKVATTSILSALTSGLAGNITSPQKTVINQKPLQSQIPIQKKDPFGFTIPSLPPKGRGKPHRTIAPSPPQPPPALATAPPTQSTSLSSQNSYLAQLLTTGTYPGAIVSVKQESQPSVTSAITSTCNINNNSFTIQSVTPETVMNPGSNTITIQPLPVQAGTLQTSGNLQPAGTLKPAGTLQPAGILPAGVLQTGNRTAANYLYVSPQAGSQDGSRPVSTQVSPVNIAAVLQSAGVSLTDFPTSILLAAANHAFSPNNLTVQEVLQNVSVQNVIPMAAPVVASSPVKPTSPAPATPTHSAFSMSPVPTSPVTSPASSSFDDSFKSAEETVVEMMMLDDDLPDTKRVSHQSAEKRRRTNIKGGFEVLHTIIPSLSQNPSAKVSKAAMLQKTAEYCKKLKSDRSQMQNEADILKQEINSLNQSISVCQSQLPATGVPVTRQRADQMREMFEEYVKQRTLNNWKFWIFSLIIRNLFDSYNNMVSTASVDDLCRTVLSWLDQHCSLVNLRPIAMNAMRHLSTTTSILSDPSRVPEQAAQAVIKRKDSNSSQP